MTKEERRIDEIDRIIKINKEYCGTSGWYNYYGVNSIDQHKVDIAVYHSYNNIGYILDIYFKGRDNRKSEEYIIREYAIYFDNHGMHIIKHYDGMKCEEFKLKDVSSLVNEIADIKEDKYFINEIIVLLWIFRERRHKYNA